MDFVFALPTFEKSDKLFGAAEAGRPTRASGLVLLNYVVLSRLLTPTRLLFSVSMNLVAIFALPSRRVF